MGSMTGVRIVSGRTSLLTVLFMVQHMEPEWESLTLREPTHSCITVLFSGMILTLAELWFVITAPLTTEVVGTR